MPHRSFRTGCRICASHLGVSTASPSSGTLNSTSAVLPKSVRGCSWCFEKHRLQQERSRCQRLRSFSWSSIILLEHIAPCIGRRGGHSRIKCQHGCKAHRLTASIRTGSGWSSNSRRLYTWGVVKKRFQGSNRQTHHSGQP